MAGRKPNRQLLARPPRIGRRPSREREFWLTPPLPGWPGWRTRRGRSGYDPIDYRLEAAHMQGMFLRKILEGRLRTRSPLAMILMGIGGVSGTMILCPFLLALSSGWNNVSLIFFLAPFLTFGYIGIVLLINFFANVRDAMSPQFNLLELEMNDSAAAEQCAALLAEGFKEHWPNAWPTIEKARDEVREMLAEGRINRIAIDRAGNVVGWIGGIPQYDGNVWELHPLVVKPDQQMQGIGRMLVRDFEQEVKRRGGLTIMLGTDDEDSMTSVSNVNLYEDTWAHIADIENLKGHPYEFYQKVGFTIVGVVPDANGRSKPDILMAKRVG